MNSILEGCKSVKSIDIPNMNLSKANNMTYWCIYLRVGSH